MPEEKDKEVPDANVTHRKGVKLEARIVGPDNSPVKNAMGWCAEMQATQLDNWVSPSPISDGRFELEGADPERGYRAFFVEAKRKLGAVAELKYDSKGPVVVRLQATATAKGTMVDEKGKLLQGSQILPWIVLTRDDRELKAEDFRDESMATAYAIFTQETLPDSHPAEFKYDNLIPGLRSTFDRRDISSHPGIEAWRGTRPRKDCRQTTKGGRVMPWSSVYPRTELP